MKRYIQHGALLALASMVVWGGCGGCGDTEEKIVLATSTGPPAPTASAELEPDGAGGSGGDGGGGADGGVPRTPPPAPPSWVVGCCKALRSNLPSVPTEQKGAHIMVLGFCDVALKNPQLADELRRLLPKGAPNACSR